MQSKYWFPRILLSQRWHFPHKIRWSKFEETNKDFKTILPYHLTVCPELFFMEEWCDVLLTSHLNSSGYNITSYFKLLLFHQSDRSPCRANIIVWRSSFLNVGFHWSAAPYIKISEFLSVSLSITASHFSWRHRYLILLKHWQTSLPAPKELQHTS